MIRNIEFGSLILLDKSYYVVGAKFANNMLPVEYAEGNPLRGIKMIKHKKNDKCW